jgi:hypothetical protein
MSPVADTTLRIADHKFCVMYESTNGKIVSVFESKTLEGAVAPDAEELQERARTLTRRLMQDAFGRHVDYDNVESIVVGPEAFEEQGPKKVDLESRMVVAAEE